MRSTSKAVREARVPRRFSGGALKDRMTAAGVSTEQLAVRIGKSAFTVRDYETGRTSPSVQALADMADALACEIGDLFVPEVA